MAPPHRSVTLADATLSSSQGTRIRSILEVPVSRPGEPRQRVAPMCRTGAPPSPGSKVPNQRLAPSYNLDETSPHFPARAENHDEPASIDTVALRLWHGHDSHESVGKAPAEQHDGDRRRRRVIEFNLERFFRHAAAMSASRLHNERTVSVEAEGS